jgi:hypothetical protein
MSRAGGDPYGIRLRPVASREHPGVVAKHDQPARLFRQIVIN